MQEEFGQWLPQPQDPINLCFSSFIMPSQIDSSIEQQARTCAVISSEKESINSLVIENDSGPTQGIDLNKTPLQKPKRKKHRPKVIKEGKPAKTPKSRTPKPPKDKGEQPSVKRKYVRRKGLNAPVNQPPLEVADSHSRTEPKPVRRRLNFDGEDRQENGHLGSSSISTGHRDSQGQVACHLGATTSSIYSSADLVANAQELLADSMPKGVMFDLNSSINQIQSENIDFTDNSGQFFQPATRETLDTNQLLDFCASVPDRNIYDLNSSMNQMQNGSTNFAEYLLLSPQTCTRETVRIDQMLNGYRMPENPITPAQRVERDVMRENLNELARKNDYLKFATNQSRHMEASLGLRDSCNISDILAIGAKSDHNVVNGTQVSLDMNFHHTYNARDFVNDCPATSSQTSYFPETYKKMRTENHKNWVNGVVGKFSSPSMYLSTNWNTNQVSAINSEVFTLADAQRLMALEKSRASQRMLAFGLTENNTVKRSNLLQHNDRSTLDGTTNNDRIATPDKQFRYMTAERTQLPNALINPLTAKYIPRSGSHQLQSLENNMVKGSDLLAQLHNTSPQDDTTNNNCIATPDKQSGSICAERIRSPITPISPSTGNDILRSENCQLEASRETVAAKPSEKPKVKRRPRKEKVGPAKRTSKVRRADLLKHEGISCVSGPSTGMTPGAKALDSARNREKMSCLWTTSDHNYYSSRNSEHAHGGSIISGAIAPLGDPLDVIIQKMKFLDISKADEIVATEPQNALVPYKGEYGAMVPYKGTVKKRRSRAKVNLDPITNLMWKLLMGQDMSDGVEGMNKDKEKWLDEERRIFRGRVDSFIARMHLVQGDRRFSPWKGSVVDSVVGVFLTQNVSDHLSSSAFMALAAKFPAKSEGPGQPGATVFHTSPERKDSCCGPFGDAIKLQGKFFVEEISDIGSLITTEEKEGSNSNDLFGSTSGDRGVDCSAGIHSNSCGESLNRLHGSRPGTLVTAIGSASVVEAEDGSLEDVVSSQNSAVSSQSSPDYLFHTTDHVGSSSLSNFAAEEFIVRNMSNSMGSSTSYTELLRMQDLQSKSSEKIGSSEYHRVHLLPVPSVDKGTLLNEVSNLSGAHQSVHTSISYVQNGQLDFPGIPSVNHLDRSLYTGLDTMNDSNVTQTEACFYQLSSASGMVNKNKTKITESSCSPSYGIDESLSQKRSPFPSEPAQEADLISPIVKQYLQPLISSETVACAKEHPFCQNNLSRNETQAPFGKQHECLNLKEECTTRMKQMGGEKFQLGCAQQEDDVRVQITTNGGSSNLHESQKANRDVLQGATSNLMEKSNNAQKGSSEVPGDGLKAKKVKAGASKNKTYDWDSLRKEVFCNGGKKERGCDAKDSLDWEAVRQADVREISETIRERGMNNMLAERIKEFLNRLVTDHGSVDLEWLRDVQPDKAKDYLLSIRGLGLKSVECVRLLTLHHLAFPVDTNVGRICVRLGWVPLQPLPESLQLHLLELYPMLENIQKYLWPRLCKLDQRTLYELHYQMITFGKVFCTKSKPNCNACPMRAECKHFASAFASARLALPGPEEKSLVASATTPLAAESCRQPYINSRPAVQLEWNAASRERVVLDNYQPIIEEPASPEPEPESAEIKESAIEDAFLEDPEEIPTIKLNFEEFTQNLKSYMQANNIEIEDADMSKALVAITPEAASIPTPKLKNVSRLRTEHQVYELPDSHPLLEGFDQREPDDPCPYLLSIWTPGETAQSIEAPKTFCNSQETGKLCESVTCFSCNSVREMQAQKVRATLLIPCRTAMRGSFPLNGTYFQVNEVFADHHTSRNPIDVPRSWIWNLPRRTVYFGTSIPTIFKGLTTEDIQHCFWRGFVCVRGFDRGSRAPRPLYARLHFPASKVTRNKKSAASAAARGTTGL